MSGRNLPIGDRYRVHGIDRAVFDIEGLVDRDALRFGPILGQILCNFAGMGIALGLAPAAVSGHCSEYSSTHSHPVISDNRPCAR